MPEVHLLQNEYWQVGILPETGGSVAFGRIFHSGQWLDYMRPTPPDQFGSAGKCTSFVLVPWSNRIRDGLLRFRDQTYQLVTTPDDGTARHGVGRSAPWQVVSSDSAHIRLHLNSTAIQNVNFPFSFESEVEYRLTGRDFSITTVLSNRDTQAMPGGFGHHPYFCRNLRDADDPVSIEIPYSQHFVLDRGMPDAPAVPIPADADFRVIRPLGSIVLDHCVTSHDSGKPIRMVYPASGAEIQLTADDIFTALVIYSPEGSPYYAIEPVTHANDGFNLYAKGISGSGVFELETNESKQGVMTFSLIG